MLSSLRIAFLACLFPVCAVAAGDPENGAHLFDRQCTSCHVVKNEAGEVLAGRGARTGPNLYGIVGRTIAVQDGFRYSTAMQAAAEEGVVWTRDTFARYAENPTAWLRSVLENRRARSKMAYRLHDPSEAEDIFAFLAQFE